MNVLMVCAELAPLAKTGGLGDAVAGLSAALARGAHDVRVLLPSYTPERPPAAVIDTIVDGVAGRRYLEVRDGTLPMRIYLLDAPVFRAGGRIYLGDERDAARFMALTDAAAGFAAATGWMPDIVHCHDWHTALVPVLLRADGTIASRSVLTLHNIGYQGVFPASAVDLEAHAPLRPWIDETAFPPSINFLRTGIRAADALTTVSPTYAAEIQSADFGYGLEDVLVERSADLKGILNGVDYSIWDPAVDPYLDVHYRANDVAPKLKIKRALCAHLGLAFRREAPVLGVVTRLAAQKGIDLLAAILPDLLERTSASFALLGSGDGELERALAQIAAGSPRRVSFTCGYDEALAHRILAGSDVVLVPSRYEPCGLTQMYALRYGSIPVVRATGGLADTVAHFDPSTGKGNGSVFEHADAQGLAWGIDQALAWFADRVQWRTVVANAMAADFSWARRAPDYASLYERLLDS